MEFMLCQELLDFLYSNDKYTIEYHINTFKEMAKTLNGYTKKCVISFLDFYPKINDRINHLNIHKISDKEINYLASELVKIAKANDITIATCAEKIDLETFGIEHNACIDGNFIEMICGKKLKSVKKDPSQRELYQCIASRDIGTYGTCKNGCIYCYANPDNDEINNNFTKYDPLSPILCDTLKTGDIISDTKVTSLFKK